MFFCAILILVNKNNKKKYNKNQYRQSDMHNMLKNFFDISINQNILNSQSKKRKEKKNIKVLVLGQDAYWVIDNIFYIGKALNGKVKPETGTPIDTSNMSKEKIEQMLFILDSLKNGNSNDSRSTGNE
jgi:archaellin